MNKKRIILTTVLLGLLHHGMAQEIKVTGINAKYHNGQTFVTWKDAAEGKAAMQYRYSVYRSQNPITRENLSRAEVCMTNVLYNSAKLLGMAFTQSNRLDLSKPTAVIEEGGQPLPMWSGVAVVTVKQDAQSYYAVVAVDLSNNVMTRVVAGESATKLPVAEKKAEIAPVKFHDSSDRGANPSKSSILGTKGLPLLVCLHGSGGSDRTVGYRPNAITASGDHYLYFSRPEWGWRDGLPGIFSVEKASELVLKNCDAIEYECLNSCSLQTHWFGYACRPQWAEHNEPRAYNFTERRLLWIIDWVIKKYETDPERVYVKGNSMGAWGTTTFALRHPEIFAAIYPDRPRTRQRGLPSLVEIKKDEVIMMDDGQTPYLERMDMVRFVSQHHDDLPFYGWGCGRRDGFATWQEQVDMVKALTANHHGFAFAWNNGDHGLGSHAISQVMKYYPPGKFARNKSYPAFGNSSINNDPGPGDPKLGDMEGGINLGFHWKDVVDTENKWTVMLSNDLASSEMTVDVTPRRCQKFKARAGEKFKWTNTAGGGGEVVADSWDMVTVAKVKIMPNAETTLTITKQ